MTFRDDRQLARACRALLGTVRQEGLWTFEGPTDEAVRIAETGGGALSSGEALMVMVAFAFWNGAGACPLARVISVFDHDRTTAICELMIAVSGPNAPTDIDRWLAHYERSAVHAVAPATGA